MKLKARVRKIKMPKYGAAMDLPRAHTVRVHVDVYLPEDDELRAAALADLLARGEKLRCITIGDVEKTPEVRLREENARLRKERNRLLRDGRLPNHE